MKRRQFLQTTIFAAPFVIYPSFSKGNIVGKLPNVLIIGDSISIGYTPFVRELLKYNAEISRPIYEDGKDENCEGTTNGVKNIKRWLGEKKWDVIHFNFGLHDLKHVDPLTGTNSNNPAHPHQAGLKKYKKNLTEIVSILKTTGAKLIFATTTPYPDNVGSPLRKPGMSEKYNQAAIKIMNKNGITVNNLYAFVKPRMEELQLPKNVHFTREGSKALAEKVAERILEALNE